MTLHLRPRHVLSGLLIAAALSFAPSPAAAASTALHVIPFPGTPDAAPLSHVIFSSLKPSELKSVLVTGSHTGTHAGRLISLPDGAGAAFLPTRPFAAGERVDVKAMLASPAAGTASGAPGATALGFSFTVGVPAASPGTPAPSPSTPIQHFRSAPKLHPPPISAAANPDPASGDIFLAPDHAAQSGPMILNSRGQLLWFDPVSHGEALNLEVQRYLGRPVLTWWQGTVISAGYGLGGQNVVVNRHYRTLAVLHGGYGYSADLHEFQLTPGGTALVDSYVPVRADLTSIGGQRNGPLMDCVIQELDVRTGQVLWEWHALGHVPLSASYFGKPGDVPYDYFHLNSIQQLPDGNLLISARNTWAVYEISHRTGKVIWTLGGRNSSFRLESKARFEWQHDAHLSGHVLTVFDDASDFTHHEEQQSTGKALRLNTAKKTASLVHRYAHTPPVLTNYEGSVQVLPNHDVFVGWGTAPDFSEYSRSGRQIFTDSLPLKVRSYRAYRFPWTGQPLTQPAIATSSGSNGELKVYASWNGATRVASWRVETGSRPTALKALAKSPWRGFETTIDLPHRPGYVAVQALSARGKVLGTSRVLRVTG